MCAARAQNSPFPSVTQMVGESMIAPTLRIWESFAAQKEEMASPLPLWRMFLHLPGGNQANQDRETHHHSHNRCPHRLHLKLQAQSEAMRSPSIATQLLPDATFHHRKMATRSSSCKGVEAVPGQGSKWTQLCHRGTSYLHVWRMVQRTGQDRSPVHRQWDRRPKDRCTDSLILNSSLSGGATGITRLVGTMSNQSQFIQTWEWRLM